MKLGYLLLFLLVSCSSLSTNNLTHWNIQLTKYNDRFEKRLSMAKNSLWIVDPNKCDIKKEYLKSNKFIAYQKTIAPYDKKIYTGIAIDYKNLSITPSSNTYVIIDDLNDLDFKLNPKGVILKGLYLKALKNNKLNELDGFIQKSKLKNIEIFSVEFSASLHLMQKYQKFISKHSLQGLITDSKFSGATFLHFVGQ